VRESRIRETSESDLVEPIHADSFFSVSRSGEIHERLCFEYLDEEGYYRKAVQRQELLEPEIRKLSTNMQYFLDQERVEINGERVTSTVAYTDVFLKGASSVVAVVYLIDFSGRIKDGANAIETWLEEEIAPYDFEILWRFPVGTKVLEIETRLEHEIYGDIISLWAYMGEDVGGHERMSFLVPPSRFDKHHET
jgi:hypothetical protein